MGAIPVLLGRGGVPNLEHQPISVTHQRKWASIFSRLTVRVMWLLAHQAGFGVRV